MTASAWAYHHPVQLCGGPGSLSRLAEFVPGGVRVLLVTTRGFERRGMVERVVSALPGRDLLVHADVTPNPALDDLDDATARLVPAGIAYIVALGGGSVIDAAKVLSVTLPSGLARPLQLVLRDGTAHTWSSHIPVIAIPTTSGTGAEVTPFATVWDTVTFKKHSVAGEHVFPARALLDPELTLSLPAEETLHTGLDAVSHALESLWNRNRTPISEAFALQSLRMATEHLPAVLARADDLQARAGMQSASVLAGLAISQTRTAIAHAISYPLTSRFGVPHGLACSFTLPRVVDLYLAQFPDSRFAADMQRAAVMLDGLQLRERVARYATDDQIAALHNEMHTPGRADNFVGRVESLGPLLARRKDA